MNRIAHPKKQPTKAVGSQRLTAKQARFAEEYVLDHNGAAAAARAGYSARSAKQIANELLTKPDLQAAIAAQEALVAAELGMTRQRVVSEILGAIDLARSQSNPAGMIAGWSAVAKICGLNAPERVTVGVETSVSDNDFTRMSDAELLAVVAEGSDDSTAPSMTNGSVVHEAKPASGGSAFSRRMTAD
ncbi:MAG: terminase small subunit [Burkholderiaceae bacterium]|jgi:phage terminase small subunit|nr:terminase small subunit [Burkholderiaceae bacterium]